MTKRDDDAAIFKMPALVQAEDAALSNEYANKCVQAGWVVKRRIATYFTAEKRIGDVPNSIGVSIRNGLIAATRSQVSAYDDTNTVLSDWIEAEI